MATELEKAFDYADVTPQSARKLREAAEWISEKMIASVLEVGDKLNSVKKLLPHGEFGSYMEQMCDLDRQRGWEMMRAAEVFTPLVKSPESGHLIGKSAMYALAAPSCPPKALEEATELLQIGEVVTYANAQEMIKKHKPPKPESEDESNESKGESKPKSGKKGKGKKKGAVNGDLLPDPEFDGHNTDIEDDEEKEDWGGEDPTFSFAARILEIWGEADAAGRLEIWETVLSLSGGIVHCPKCESEDAVPVAGVEQLIEWWNRLAPDVGAAKVAVRPSSGVKTGFSRMQKEVELQDGWSDLVKLEEAIRNSPFCHNSGWFTLPKLLSGKNRDGDYLVTKLLAGGFREADSGREAVVEYLERKGWQPTQNGQRTIAHASPR